MQFHFERLTVWQLSMELVQQVYSQTQPFPAEERFGLVSQLRRAAVSIPANIAEGKGRFHKKEFLQFLYNARGSLYETITLLRLSQKLRYLQANELEGLLDQCRLVGSQLSGLTSALKGSLPGAPNPAP